MADDNKYWASSLKHDRGGVQGESAEVLVDHILAVSSCKSLRHEGDGLAHLNLLCMVLPLLVASLDPFVAYETQCDLYDAEDGRNRDGMINTCSARLLTYVLWRLGELVTHGYQSDDIRLVVCRAYHCFRAPSYNSGLRKRSAHQHVYFPSAFSPESVGYSNSNTSCLARSELQNVYNSDARR